MSKPAVPKFASFKPRSAIASPHASESDRKPTGDSDASRRKDEDDLDRHHPQRGDRPSGSDSRSKKKDRRREHEHHHREHRSSSNRRHRDPSLPSNSAQVDTQAVFVLDKKGDSFNVKYGTMHQYDIPSYRRRGYGHVIGLGRELRIDGRSRDERRLSIIHRYRDSDSRQHKERQSWSFSDEHAAILTRSKIGAEEVQSEGPAASFISLISEDSRKRRRLTSDGEDRQEYRSIHKSGEETDNESDSDQVSTKLELERFDLGLSSVAQNRLREFSRNVDEQPYNIEAWLRLIQAQELLFQNRPDVQKNLTGSETRSLADMRVSLYEKALKNFTVSSLKVRLIEGMLKEGAKLWDWKKRVNKWQEVLRENPTSLSLWRGYLDFQQTSLLSFNFEQGRTIFNECLAVINKAESSHSTEHVWMYLFLRMTLFIREAGYSELSLALWQALLEFNFFRPEGLQPNASIAAFEEFWDSEALRIGEDGAKGWRNSLDQSASQGDLNTSQAYGIDPGAAFETWSAAEQARSLSSHFPARTLDEVEEDDPFRVILFSDIENYLRFWPNRTGRRRLVSAFLCFCRLPPLQRTSDEDDTCSWLVDPFLRNDPLETPGSGLAAWLGESRGDDIDSHQSIPSSAFPLPNFTTTPDSLLADRAVTDAFASFDKIHSKAVDGDTLKWISSIMKSLVEEMADDEDLAELALSLAFRHDEKAGKKYAKALLKKRQFSLRLYNAYALMECRSGNFSTAEHVWTTTLGMQAAGKTQSTIGGLTQFWRTWIWETMRNGNPAKAISLLLSIPEGSVKVDATLDNATMNNVRLLKAQTHFTDIQQHALIQRDLIAFIYCSECLALLEYLRHKDLKPALDVFKASYLSLQSKDLAQDLRVELLEQTKAILIDQHISSPETRMYRPSQLALVLAESLSRFPNNTIILSIHHKIEARILITDRLRMKALLPNEEPTLIGALFKIFTESHRLLGGTTPSTRAAFEQATSSDHLRSSASLWCLWVEFEIRAYEQQADLDDRRAAMPKSHRRQKPASSKRTEIAARRVKDVFYAGLRAVPWVKEYMMIAFTRLFPLGIFEFEDCKGVYNVMAEKGLRIRVDLEDVLEELGQRREENMPIRIPLDREDSAEAA